MIRPLSFLFLFAVLLAIPGRAAAPFTVPLDLWIYPALDRLASLGLIPSQSTALRPWTISECLRQVTEARRQLAAGTLSAVPALEAHADDVLTDVENELTRMSHTRGVRLDTLYFRPGVIAGTPLSDGWHFGQTWTNDRGRPVGNGLNTVSGVSSSAGYGPVALYFRGEVQTSETPAAPSDELQKFLARLDGLPADASFPSRGRNRTRVDEAYVGYQYRNVAVSAGKQALWWGPTYDTPLSFSTNAEATENLRIYNPSPFRLPGILRHFGHVRAEFVIGRLGRHQYTRNPWFNAQKITFKMTRDLELGFTRWSIFWGDGHPKTAASFFRNFFRFSSHQASGPLDPGDPGDRKGGFDIRYRLPARANFLTLYADSYAEDDPSPLAAPRRAAISGGAYLSRLPGLSDSPIWSRQDLRLEFQSTDPLGTNWNLNYYNNQYRSGNTNMGLPMGSWVGRAGRAISAWTGHSFAANRRIELGYQHLKVDGTFLPGGATQSRANLRATWQIRRQWLLEGYLQGERYWFPVMGPRRNTLSAWISIAWRPMLCAAGCTAEARATVR